MERDVTDISTKDLLAEIGELYVKSRRLSTLLEQERAARLAAETRTEQPVQPSPDEVSA